MHMLLLTMFGTAAVIGAAALLVSFRLFDRLVRMEFSDRRGDWEQHGCPIGFFWVPHGTPVISGSFARTALLSEWSHAAPRWIRDCAVASEVYRSFRRAQLIAHLSFAVAAAIIAGLFIFVVTRSSAA
jgi:hypothetical protein